MARDRGLGDFARLRLVLRTLAAPLFAVALLVLFFALSVGTATRPDAEFSFVNGTEPRTLDPGVMTGAPEGRIADAIFEGLMVRDPESLRPVPGVAEGVRVSSDGRRFTFELREEARWTDGTRVTAHDFAYAWRRLLDPARGAEYAYLLHGLRYAEAWNTHAGHSEALEGPVREALLALAARAPEAGVTAGAWQRFLAEHHVRDRVRGETSAATDGLLERRSGRLRVEELEVFGAALARIAQRRRASAAEAALHFGLDAGVFAESEDRLVVELQAPLPYFLELTAFYPLFPVPRARVEERPADWFLPAHIVSNGPFRLASWDIGDRIRLERNETYWAAEKTGLATIDALPVENATTALNLYLTETVDWLPGLYPADLVDVLRERDDFYSGPGLVLYYYRLNTRRPPFDDPRVREALALAIDRDAIVDDVLRLGQIPAHHVVPPGLPAYAQPPSRLGHDPARARRLLREAGFPGGQGVPAFGILFNTHESHKQIAELIADQWRRTLGLEVTAYNQEWQAYQSSVLAGDFDVARAGWIGDYLDPNTFLDLWVTGGGNNQTGWGDPRYDRLIRAASDAGQFARAGTLPDGLREPDVLEGLVLAVRGAGDEVARAQALGRLRMQLFREAEAILVQEAFPILPIYYYVVSGLVKPHVGGFHATLRDPDGTTRPNLQDLHPLRGLRLRR